MTDLMYKTVMYNVSIIDIIFRCRKTQTVFDKCVKDNLGIDRPPYDYFNRVHVHKTARPRPPTEGPAVYPDATPKLPDDAPRPPAKMGPRHVY